MMLLATTFLAGTTMSLALILAVTSIILAALGKTSPAVILLSIAVLLLLVPRE